MADDNLALTFHDSAPDADFDAIHDAFVDTERGRWFLFEFARRNRHADTALLLAAIGRIESILLAQRAVQSLPYAPQDPATLANPSAIKPDGDNESKSESNDRILRVLGQSTARLHAAIQPLRDVSWSMREQGDMRCDVLDRQAVEIAQACAAFDSLREELGGADAEEVVSAVAEPAPTPRAEMDCAAPAATLEPEEIPAGETPEPPPAQNFARAPLLQSLPLAREQPFAETHVAPPEPVADAVADDTFEDMLFEAGAAELPSAPDDEIAPVTTPHGTPETHFDSSQAKRLSRLINLFAGESAPAGNEPPQNETTDDAALAPPAQMPVVAADVARSEQTIVPNPVAETHNGARPNSEPADFLLEPWPHVSQPAIEQPPADVSPAPAIEPAPAAMSSAPPSPAVTKGSLFPMSRPVPSDPLAPILALSDEEKIALFS